MQSGKSANSVRFPIGVKLIVIISAIVIVALTSMNLVVGWFVVQDTTARLWESNGQVARLAGAQVATVLDGLVAKSRLVVEYASESGSPGNTDRFLEVFFRDTPEILAVAVPDGFSYVNPAFAPGEAGVAKLLGAETGRISRARSGELVVFNPSAALGSPCVCMAVPLERSGTTIPCVVLSSADALMKAVDSGDGLTTVFVVNAEGSVIAHRDAEKVLAAAELGSSPIVQAMKASAVDSGVTRFDDPETGINFMGAYRKTGLAGIGVVSMVESAKSFKAIDDIQRRNWYLLAAAIAIAVLVVYLYSKSITRPIRALARGAIAIQEGNFELDIKPTTRDEIGVLTASFVEMGKGLAEREKLKDTFGKFVNKEIAERILKEDIKLGGERKRGTIFFSDIRGFTSISENLEPEEVVEFLNKYMSLMVKVINHCHGVVDKYIGDAIMAVWGIPVTYGNDAINAVGAALDMRRALLEFNVGRGGAHSPIIRIGCGLNTGNVLAGQIGSNERMEYTVIGDAVNLASRIEALNKPLGTDILISSDTYELVKSVFYVEEMPSITVKGKAEPQRIYAVCGRRGEPGAMTSMRQVREALGIASPDLAGFDPDAEELKYSIAAPRASGARGA